MRRSSLTSMLEVCATASIATSTPLISRTKNEPRAPAGTSHVPGVNCTDIHAVYDQSCWGQLNLSDWLINWNQTVPICGVRGTVTDNSKCCIPDAPGTTQLGEPWSTCFLRLATATSGLDCSQISSRYCSLDVPVQVDASIEPQVHYVVKNLVSK